MVGGVGFWYLGKGLHSPGWRASALEPNGSKYLGCTVLGLPALAFVIGGVN